MMTAPDTPPAGWNAFEGMRRIDIGAAPEQPPSPPAAPVDARAALRESWRQAHRWLQTARQSGDARAMAQALDAIDALLDSLDLHEALEALAQPGALAEPAQLDRLAPWTWLGEIWDEIEPLAKARQLRVRLKVHGDASVLGPVYGSAVWLRRLLRECLGSAVRAAAPGQRLDIDYRQTGPRALIVLHDSHAFTQANDRLRLALCQRIAALHGGELRQEWDEQKCDWLIDLPTGAPYHPVDASIDQAQAQRFAAEWSAVRARAAQRHNDATSARPPSSEGEPTT